MKDVDTVFYCIVDARAWLRDPSPLYATNVEALRKVLDVAVEVGVPKFVFCSSVVTMRSPSPVRRTRRCRTTGVTWVAPTSSLGSRPRNWSCATTTSTGCQQSCSTSATTYGPRDHGPTPHGKLVRAAARGKVPAYAKGASMEVVGIEDAAAAFLLAEERGRPGERYIVSERYLPIKDLFDIAPDEGGARPPKVGIPLPVMRVIGAVGGGASRLLRKDSVVTSTSVRLMHIQTPLDHSKATRELGWEPAPIADSIRSA